MKKKTREETAEAQTDTLVVELEELYRRAKMMAASESEYNKRQLVAQALILARLVRRIAGVR